MTTSDQQQRLTIDIRVFLLVTVTAMAISFGVGVTMGPTGMIGSSSPSYSALPEVHSVDFSQDLNLKEGDVDAAVHEPAGQVRFADLLLCLNFRVHTYMSNTTHGNTYIHTYQFTSIQFTANSALARGY